MMVGSFFADVWATMMPGLHLFVGLEILRYENHQISIRQTKMVEIA